MKMTYTCITIIASFLTDTLNWQMLWGKDKYLLNNLYEKLKNKVSLTQNVNNIKFVSSKEKQIN